jgi:hypothetical protein
MNMYAHTNPHIQFAFAGYKTHLLHHGILLPVQMMILKNPVVATTGFFISTLNTAIAFSAYKNSVR